MHLDARVRYVSKVPLYDIPSYWATDIKLSWKANENLSLSFIGQNIFDPRHPEFGQYYALRTPLREVERSFFLKITWQK
ncbi:MAG: TonB-dependent receptor [Thermodesulfobacteria bacterium]|nr:TonB-dependent receptor [Thermodesulfobacteriota bacterium]